VIEQDCTPLADYNQGQQCSTVLEEVCETVFEQVRRFFIHKESFEISHLSYPKPRIACQVMRGSASAQASDNAGTFLNKNVLLSMKNNALK